MASGNPEIIYGVQLLDDLHNYFPDLLYNNQRFTTVQSVLQYLTQSTRRRFDLFSYGRTQYTNSQRNIIRNNETDNKQNDEDDDDDDEDEEEDEDEGGDEESNVQTARPATVAHPPASARGSSPVSQPVPPPSQPRTQRSYASVLGGGSGQQSLYSLLPTLDSLVYTTLPPIQHVPNSLDQIDANMTLLSAIAGFFPSNSQLPRSFLDPVPVAPTAAQIQASSTIRTLDADMEDNCSICQDAMRSGEAIRKITQCNHTFHRSCIDTWFVRNVRCPVCRHDIREVEQASVPAPAPAQNNENPRMDEVDD